MKPQLNPVPELDRHGHLRRPDDWTSEIAQVMATSDGIVLGESHWEVIRLLRDYWQARAAAPPLRVVVTLAAVRLGKEKGNSRYLYGLFPQGPARQACRYAGLPKPVGCV